MHWRGVSSIPGLQPLDANGTPTPSPHPLPPSVKNKMVPDVAKCP